MSWGERSCQRPRIENGCKFATMATCNVDCPKYIWDGLTKPDSIKTNLSAVTMPLPTAEIDTGMVASDGNGRKVRVEAAAIITKIDGIPVAAIRDAITLGVRRAQAWFREQKRKKKVYVMPYGRKGKYERTNY